MVDERIEGFLAGSVSLTVANIGAAVLVSMSARHQPGMEAALSVHQSRRLRRLLSAAEKRAQP